MGGEEGIRSIVFLLILCLATTTANAQVADERAENMQIGLQSNFMSADQS